MKTAKIFQNGRSRAVRIPREWLKGAEEVELSREGDAVVLRPVRSTLGELARRFAQSPVEIERKPQAKTPPKALFE
ncbi:MAG: antitoxin [Coraliomargarita sp.]